MLPRHYSGTESREFWNIINNASEDQWHSFYTIGVALQNLESEVLSLLDSLEQPPLIQKEE